LVKLWQSLSGDTARFISRFSLWHKRRKEKSYQKRNAEEQFRALRSARRAARPPPRKLLKKFDQNFDKAADIGGLFCRLGNFSPPHFPDIFFTPLSI